MDVGGKPYRELRFMAGLIEYVGLVIIILGVGAALYFDDIHIYWRAGIGAGVVVVGMAVAAAGQIYSAFLDIRDDVRATLQSVRRIELITKENKDT